jgi:hypothetical protein
MDSSPQTADEKIEFRGEALRAIEAFKKGENVLITGPAGTGKCLDPNTPVMMFNGNIKKAKDVVKGDLLMGDDSTPRTVLGTTTGRETMYRVVPSKGESYVVNEPHVLSLVYSGSPRIKMEKDGRYRVQWFDGHQRRMCTQSFGFKSTRTEGEALRLAETYLQNMGDYDGRIDISVKDYLKLPQHIKRQLKGYRVPVDFPCSTTRFNPYIIGYWLGDGSFSGTGLRISTGDSKILEVFKERLSAYNLELKHISRYDYSIRNKDFSNKANSNPLMSYLRSVGLKSCTKFVPQEFKYNSQEVRMQLLAGFIDADGHWDKKSHGYDIVQKSEVLLDDIIYVARSLGFSAYKNPCQKSCMYKGERKEGTYYRCFISGSGMENIPVVLPRKKSTPRSQVKDVLRHSIKVQKIGIGDYAGFELDGNHRFLLGDFTVTHNTTLLNALLELCGKNARHAIITGTTGVSALQLLNGKTLHSALRIPVGTFPSPKKLEAHYWGLWNKAKQCGFKGYDWLADVIHKHIIIVDEVSMLSSWMMEAVDIALGVLRDCKDKPWGGMQVVFVGDFLQLPPVYNRKDPNVPRTQGDMAFESPVWSALKVQRVELVKIHRQKDADFARMLNCIRHGDALKGTQLQQFDSMLNNPPSEEGIKIMVRRKDVKEANERHIAELAAQGNVTHTYKYPVFQCIKKQNTDDRSSDTTQNQEAQDEGKQLDKMMRESLHLEWNCKQQVFVQGSRVMLIRNMKLGTIDNQIKMVNGDTGTIVGFRLWHDPPPFAKARYGNATLRFKGRRTAPPAYEEEPVGISPPAYYSAQTHKSSRHPLETVYPVVRFDRIGMDLLVPVFSWQRGRIDRANGDMNILASMDAIPLIAAFSITSHKVQGATIPDIPIHINGYCMHFAEATFYVSVSRATEFGQISITDYKGHKQSRKALAYYKGCILEAEAKRYGARPPNEQMFLDIQADARRILDEREEKRDQEITPEDLLEGLVDDSGPSYAPSSSSSSEWAYVQLDEGRAGKSLNDLRRNFDRAVKPVLGEFRRYYQGVTGQKRRTDEFLHLVEEWVKKEKSQDSQRRKRVREHTGPIRMSDWENNDDVGPPRQMRKLGCTKGKLFFE